MTEVYKDDVSTVFEITLKEGGVVVDVSTASVKQIRFKKADDTTLTKDASFTTDGTDGKIEYTTVANDIDQDGTWEIQAYIEMGGGKWSSDIERFEVFPNIGD